VFIPVIEPLAIKKVESKKVFAHLPTINLFFTLYYPAHPTTPFTHHLPTYPTHFAMAKPISILN
jgi:hypothetical protein